MLNSEEQDSCSDSNSSRHGVIFSSRGILNSYRSRTGSEQQYMGGAPISPSENRGEVSSKSAASPSDFGSKSQFRTVSSASVGSKSNLKKKDAGDFVLYDQYGKKIQQCADDEVPVENGNNRGKRLICLIFSCQLFVILVLCIVLNLDATEGLLSKQN